MRVIPSHPTRFTFYFLHGAGESSTGTIMPVAAAFARAGFEVLAVDFSGDGDSGGDRRSLSLWRRAAQAASFIASTRPAGRFGVVGFSMSGQTVADVVELHPDAVDRIVLFSPAVYTQAAWDLPFDRRFTRAIRRADGWRDSRALTTYAAFHGAARLVTPGQDDVIPGPVTAAVAAALATGSRLDHLVLPAASHRLGPWLAGHPADLAQVVGRVVAMSPQDGPIAEAEMSDRRWRSGGPAVPGLA